MTDKALSTAILTEHLGYAPIGLIDDIINAVNEVLYKCTSELEKVLVKNFPLGGSRAIKYKIPSDEIELGTAKLETLLESVVDRAFDKFELYVLRNLLVIPGPLISGGWIRLAHHQHVDFGDSSTTDSQDELDSIDREILALEKALVEEQVKHRLYTSQAKSASEHLHKAQEYQQALHFLSTSKPASSSQFNDILIFLTSQVSAMINTIETIEKSLSAQHLIPKLNQDSRDKYLNQLVWRAIQHSGVWENTVTVDVTGRQSNAVLRELLDSDLSTPVP